MAERTSAEIQITRILDASPEDVVRAWTDAEQLARWWGPEGFTVPRAESDAREGGALTIVMRGPDGSDHTMTGTYREFAPPRRVVIASQVVLEGGVIALEAVTTLTLEDRDGKTELTVHERAEAVLPEAVAMLGGMEVGMVQSLRRLDDVLTGAVDRQIVLGRMYEASRETVFDALTHEEHLARWWGPNGFTLTTETIDVRPGGAWRFTMHGPDGVDYPNVIEYEEVVAPALLSFSHGGGPEDPVFRGVITLDEYMGATILTMRSVFDTAADRDLVVERYGAIEGGTQTLDRLGEFLGHTLKSRHET
jgi:uncharacterized protein YndB with AHSA1/START domain